MSGKGSAVSLVIAYVALIQSLKHYPWKKPVLLLSGLGVCLHKITPKPAGNFIWPGACGLRHTHKGLWSEQARNQPLDVPLPARNLHLWYSVGWNQMTNAVWCCLLTHQQKCRPKELEGDAPSRWHDTQVHMHLSWQPGAPGCHVTESVPTCWAEDERSRTRCGQDLLFL